ncbi:LysM peptidoglycan-binding domain-containing protein [Desemzia sp. RIT804]|uniref:glucosaminidase domain-containing protein n=1 Tax=Desemzia sp. RIT 804 TaxID=2810209 RepID=UPI001950D3F6|nr:glucosaminidase domain-containing protein [Desemzia sp. RIT 804]MBM6614004.1 LysM peptidoglycan-binding domain-containing protein [Desemzia sp. RIT 804]MBM6614087.1 LysM peptidoglycan-binding domain-containing protein [Desemzia sp. RIT 804]MBM6614170.1 LysM peptidoglycan-binding domain-containing protein [Desemzia sp. RIT 804]
MAQVNFLNNLHSGAIATFNDYGILPSITSAQAILESNWGKSKLAQESRNLFGIKADKSWKGEKKAYSTKEYDKNGNLLTVTDYFRKYPSYEESLKDHGKFFHENQRYADVIGLRDYKKQARSIQTAGYATDPQYANKLIQIIEQNELQKWDQEVLTQTSFEQPNNTAMHKVRKGDSLSEIAERYAVSVQSIATANQLDNPNLIYPDQQLIIPVRSHMQSKEEHYVVKTGDTLSSIAQQFDTSIQKLVTENHISNVNHIEVGQTLKINS